MDVIGNSIILAFTHLGTTLWRLIAGIALWLFYGLNVALIFGIFIGISWAVSMYPLVVFVVTFGTIILSFVFKEKTIQKHVWIY